MVLAANLMFSEQFQLCIRMVVDVLEREK